MKELNLFINHVSRLTKEERIKYLALFGVDGKKIIFDNIVKLTDLLKLNEIKDYHLRVKLRADYMKLNPGRHWDYAEYQSADGLYKFNDVLVSTDGHIVKLFKTGRVGVLHHYGDYSDSYHRFAYGTLSLRTHRAVGSTFLPIPERLKSFNINKLDLSFIDRHKKEGLTKLDNIEWLYGNEKNRKAARHLNYLDDEYFLFKITHECEFKGIEFTLNHNEIKDLGMEPKALRKYPKGASSRVLGMDIRYIGTNNGYPKMPEKLKALFNKNNKYFNVWFKPIIGKVLEGEYKGLEFSLFGEDEIDSIFPNNNIYFLLKRSKKEFIINGCSFRNANHMEAIPLHGKLTPDTIKNIRLLVNVKN